MTIIPKETIDARTTLDSMGDILMSKNTQSNSQNDFSETNQTKKRHIVLVTETWFPDINGVSMSLGKLMNCLSDMGHTISLIRPTPKVTKISSSTGFDDSLNDNNNLNDNSNKSSNDIKNSSKQSFITHDIQVRGLPIPKYTDLQLGLPSHSTIKKQLKNIKPDIVHIATEGPLGLSALVAAKRLKIPVTTGYHTQFHDFSQHFGIGLIATPMMAYFRCLHNWSDATCVPSKKTEKDLASLGFRRLYQVGRGVDMESFNPDKCDEALRKSWNVGHQHTVLIMVSRLSPEKGVDLVIQAFKELQMQQLHRALKLVIIGDGPDKQRLESMSADNDDIIFAGMQTGEELCRHYASGDAFVFASQVETFGNVVTEAMASGLPVYAFDDAAAGMLVDDSCGALATVGNTAEFRQIVVALPKLRKLKQQGVVARTKVSSMSWQRPAAQMLQMFEDAIHKQSKQ